MGLIAVVLATLLMVLKFRRPSITTRQVVRAGLWTLIYALVMALCSTHLCHAGNPAMQFVLPSICLLQVLTTIHPRVARWGAAAVGLAGVVLTFHAVGLVHDGFPTNPAYAQRQEQVMKVRVAAELRHAATQPATMPAGEVPREVLVEALGETEVTADDTVLVPVLRQRWFTNLTGMYEVEREPRRVTFERVNLRNQPDIRVDFVPALPRAPAAD